ncbi:glutamate racemase [Sphingomonas sp. SUN019]|uniref:glutamate racemase n=1 Tax=Sphingomonas sp. SUN019 TaxID=2937788 RepID=UPI0038D46D67
MTDPRPILFFDSGVGGLSIVAPARVAVPHARFVYAADSAGFPYGTKSEEEIAARVPALLGRLAERYRPRLIVIACNTASTIALPAVRAALDLPIVGTVPAIKPASAASRTRVIGVLGTDATVRQGYVDDLAARFAGDCRVVRHGSAALVELAEAKLRGESLADGAVAAAVAPLVDVPDLDTVVLACTHFPLLADELRAAFGAGVSFTDGGPGIARRIAYLTEGQAWAAERAPDVAVFTRVDDSVAALTPALAARGFAAIEAL